ncbi:4'-phosphopantetheinyl transferase family protein [Chitinophagaceae bacterium LWZ2-11]
MPALVCCDHLADVTWNNSSECNFTINEGLDVWQILIEDNIHLLNEYKSVLSDDEHFRSDRYYHEKDKDRFIVSRGNLRILLGKYLKKEPGEIMFEIGNNKKPRIKKMGEGLYYNVSHSGNVILIAIAKGDVGVDVEKVEPAFPYKDVLTYIFSNEEIEDLNRFALPRERFYTLWTRKEALLKATGKGIDDNLSLITCLDGKHAIDDNIIKSDNHFFINSFSVNEQYVGSVAANNTNLKMYKFVP